MDRKPLFPPTESDYRNNSWPNPLTHVPIPRVTVGNRGRQQDLAHPTLAAIGRCAAHEVFEKLSLAEQQYRQTSPENATPKKDPGFVGMEREMRQSTSHKEISLSPKIPDWRRTESNMERDFENINPFGTGPISAPVRAASDVALYSNSPPVGHHIRSPGPSSTLRVPGLGQDPRLFVSHSDLTTGTSLWEDVFIRKDPESPRPGTDAFLKPSHAPYFPNMSENAALGSPKSSAGDGNTNSKNTRIQEPFFAKPSGMAVSTIPPGFMNHESGKRLIKLLDRLNIETPVDSPTQDYIQNVPGTMVDERKLKVYKRGDDILRIAYIEKWAFLNNNNFGNRIHGVPEGTKYFVIKSSCELDVFYSLKHGVWASTDLGNKRLDAAFKSFLRSGPVFLFFSVTSSGRFCGLAEMISGVDMDVQSGIWTDQHWRGKFTVRWLMTKDIPNSVFRHIPAPGSESRAVTNCRDTQDLPSDIGLAMLNIYNDYESVTSLLTSTRGRNPRNRAQPHRDVTSEQL